MICRVGLLYIIGVGCCASVAALCLIMTQTVVKSSIHSWASYQFFVAYMSYLLLIVVICFLDFYKDKK